jgi:phage baseplate assembly protein W
MPIFNVPIVNSASTSPANETEIDFFGVDLLFEDDLRLTASGDYALLEGYEALRQAIRIRLMTAPGEYAIHPDFGCGLSRWVKRRATQAERDSLRQTIIDQLSQEERIQNVEEVVVESFTQGTINGIKILVRVIALGRENSFAFATYSE